MRLLNPEWVDLMHLPADAVDRRALIHEAADEVEDGVRLRSRPFGGIVVVVELRVRIGVVGELKRHRDVFGPDLLMPEGIGSELPVIVANRLVDYVPGRDSSAIAPDHGHDVITHNGDHLVAGEVPAG